MILSVNVTSFLAKNGASHGENRQFLGDTKIARDKKLRKWCCQSFRILNLKVFKLMKNIKNKMN